MNDLNDLEVRFNQFKKALGLSNADISKSLNISKQSVGRWGKDSKPSATSLIEMRKKYGLNENWLLFGEGEMLAIETTSDFIQKMSDQAPYLGEAAKKTILDMAILLARSKDKQTQE